MFFSQGYKKEFLFITADEVKLWEVCFLTLDWAQIWYAYYRSSSNEPIDFREHKVKFKFGVCIIDPFSFATLILYRIHSFFYWIHKMSYITFCKLKIFERYFSVVKLHEERVREVEWSHSRFFLIPAKFLNKLILKHLHLHCLKVCM